MRSIALGIVAIVLAAGFVVARADQGQDAERMLKAARATQMVDRNLSGAIDQYRKLSQSPNRAVAAQALIWMAECYELQGKAEWRKIYEDVVRRFDDQKRAAATARRRLGITAGRAVSTGDRPVWTGSDVDLFGTVSPDGRFLTYVDWQGFQNVMLRDLVTNTSRPLTGNRKSQEFGTADFSAISRDGAHVAFHWAPLKGPGEFRVASLKDDGVPTSRLVRAGDYLRPFDWSPDKKSVAVLVNESQLGVVSVEDGTLRQLKSMDWRGVDKMVFSPDGRFIAYDMASADRRERRDIMIIAADGSTETAAVAEASGNYLMGWSPAGDLLFSSDRSGTRSLWVRRVVNGRPQGELRLVKEDVRATVPLGLTPSGTLYVYQAASPSIVRVTSFDIASGRIPGAATNAFQQFIEQRGWPRWSADGRHLVFKSCGVRNAPCSIFVRDGDGKPREIAHSMWYIGTWDLAPDGRAVVANGSDLKGRPGIFLIDTMTGATSLAVSRGGVTHPEWSRDGRAIRYVERDGQDLVLLEREVASGESKQVFRTPGYRDMYSPIGVSPDGKLVGFIQRRRLENQRPTFTFVVAPLAGGAAQELVTSTEAYLPYWQWASDSKSVIVQKHVGDGLELWQLPLAGNGRRLDIDGGQWGGGFHLSPDGNQIAFAAPAGRSGDEVWALENFLPAPGAKR